MYSFEVPIAHVHVLIELQSASCKHDVTGFWDVIILTEKINAFMLITFIYEPAP